MTGETQHTRRKGNATLRTRPQSGNQASGIVRAVVWLGVLCLAAFVIMPTGSSSSGYSDLCVRIRVVDQQGPPISGPFTVVLRDVEPMSRTEAVGINGEAQLTQFFPSQYKRMQWAMGMGPSKITWTCRLGGVLRISAPGYSPWERPLNILFSPTYDIQSHGTNLTCTISLTPDQGTK